MDGGRTEGGERLVRVVAATSLAFSCAYIVWRWGWTLNTDALWYSVPLALAETYGLLTAFFLTFTAWRLADRPPVPPLPGRSVDVFVTSYDEPLAIVRKTALAARDIRYPHTTYLLDDGRRDEIRALADELGIGYLRREDNRHAKAGNLNNALRHTTGEFILQLDADHVPLPHMVERLIGHFADERVAFVQSPQDFYNTDAFTYDVDQSSRRMWEDQQLFFRVLQPGKDRSNAAFFVGSCALIRRRALDDVGGFATATVTEDIETSLLLHAKGWRSVFVPETLAYGLAPSTAAAFHVQHLRWGQGAMQTMRRYRPLVMPGLTLAQRIGYLDSLTTYLGGFQRLILYLAPIIFFTTGVFPLRVSATTFALVFLPYLGLQIVSFKLLARGHGSLLLADRFAMAKFFTHVLAITGYFTRRRLAFRVTPKGATHIPASTYAPQAVLVGLTILALAWGIYERTRGASEEIAGWGAAAFWVNTIFALWHAGVAMHIVRLSLGAQQRRTEHRFADTMAVNVRVLRPDGKLSAYDVAVTENLNPHGAALRCMHPIPAGARLEMTLPLHTRQVAVRARLVRRTEHATPYGTVHAHGVVFEDADQDTRDAIEMHCAQHATPLERQRYHEGVGSARETFRRFHDLRRERRVAVGMPARIVAIEPGAARLLATGVLEDISPAGARVLIDHPIAPGSLVSVQIPGSTLETRGRVIFLRAFETSIGVRFVAGVQTGEVAAPAVDGETAWYDQALAAATRYGIAAMTRSRELGVAANHAILAALPRWRRSASAATPVREIAEPVMLLATTEPEVSPQTIQPLEHPLADVPLVEAAVAGVHDEPHGTGERSYTIPDIPMGRLVELDEEHHVVDGPTSSPSPTQNGFAPMTESTRKRLLDRRTVIEGDFVVAGSMEVQCEIRGDLRVEETITIGRFGRVVGDVTTGHAVIRGRVTGTLVARGNARVGPTGRVEGTITAKRLSVAKGARIEGQRAPADTELTRIVNDDRTITSEREGEMVLDLPNRAVHHRYDRTPIARDR